MNVVAIIQARMSSRRFPGKVLEDIHGKPMLLRVVERVKRCKSINTVVLATSTQVEDNVIAQFCEKEGITCFRGELNDVLKRYCDAAKQYSADIIVRITADCPLHDPAVIQNAIDKFKSGQFDYVTNIMQRTYPDGTDTEVLSLETLHRLKKEALQPDEREHVTLYMLRHPTQFRIGHFLQDEDLSSLRWTVDFPEDLAFVRNVYDFFGDRSFTMADLLVYLQEHPEVDVRSAADE
jgi:spore coat polysaccharide biosynthesis protein SpsF